MAEGERPPSSRIFISYRREDSAGFVRALLGPLRERFGSDRIFKDTDNIPPGQDFVKAIERELQSCQVLLAIIGSEWTTIQDSRSRTRRLDNPTDTLRVEITAALKNENTTVIPVLVDRASMPTSEDLPEDLWPLARRNAVELSDTRWDTDVERLIRAIEVICGEPALTHPAPRLSDQPVEHTHDAAAEFVHAGPMVDTTHPAITGPVWVKYLAAAAVVILAVTVASWLFSNGAASRPTPPPSTSSTSEPAVVQNPSPTSAGPSVGRTPAGPPPTGPPLTATRAGTKPADRATVPTRGAVRPGGTSGGANPTDPEPGGTSAGPTPRNTAPDATDSKPATTDSTPATNGSPSGGMPRGAPQTDSTPDAKAAIQQLLDQYVAAYRAMNEPRLKAIDPSFRGIQRRELMKSVSLTLGQPQIDVLPDGQSAILKASGNFAYVWNRAGLPSTSAAQLKWTLQKQGTIWTVVSSN
jgi:hypothetical protein